MSIKLKLVPTAIAALLVVASGVSTANAATRLQPHEEFPAVNLTAPLAQQAGTPGWAEASANKGEVRRTALDNRAQNGSAGDHAPAKTGTAARAGVSDEAASFEAIRRALVAY